MLDVAKSCKINMYGNLAAFAVQVHPPLRWAQLLHHTTSGLGVTGCSVKANFQIYYRDFFALDALFL